MRPIFEHVLVQHPYHRYNGALGHLEQSGGSGMVNPLETRRLGSFANCLDDESVRVRFATKQP